MSRALAVSREITIDIPAGGWDITGRDGKKPARLLAKTPLVICGLRMHLEAWRVVRGKRDVEADGLLFVGDTGAGTQLHPFCDDDLAWLWKIFSDGDGDFTTTRIPGYRGNWILLASPFVD
jgi:hypothetical protein